MKKIAAFLILVFVFAGCRPEPTSTPTDPPPTVVPTKAPEPTGTAIPPTSVPAPTSTPVPTNTAEPIPSSTPAPPVSVLPSPTIEPTAALILPETGGEADEPTESNLLAALLVYVLAGPTIGIAVSKLMESKRGKAALCWLAGKLAAFGLSKIEVARYTAMAATGSISLGLYWLALQLGAPLDPLTLEIVGTLFGISFGASQAKHARMKAAGG